MGFLVRSFKSLIRRFISEQQRLALSEILRLPERVKRLERRSVQLASDYERDKYEGLGNVNQDQAKSIINEYEARYYSQFGNDGILAYIFSQISASNCRFVEIGLGTGEMTNTANLFFSFGWTGLMMEIVPDSVSYARRFFGRMTGSGRIPDIVAACVLPENVNQLLEQRGVTGEIDLLSIDIDSNDYWVFEAVSVISPRVIVLEYNAVFGPQRSITIEYDPKFVCSFESPTRWYHGASLTALTKLAKLKGYRLVGCESHGADAFYVREDICTEALKELVPEHAYYHPPGRDSNTLEEQFRAISHMPFVQI